MCWPTVARWRQRATLHFAYLSSSLLSVRRHYYLHPAYPSTILLSVRLHYRRSSPPSWPSHHPLLPELVLLGPLAVEGLRVQPERVLVLVLQLVLLLCPQQVLHLIHNCPCSFPCAPVVAQLRRLGVCSEIEPEPYGNVGVQSTPNTIATSGEFRPIGYDSRGGPGDSPPPRRRRFVMHPAPPPLSPEGRAA